MKRCSIVLGVLTALLACLSAGATTVSAAPPQTVYNSPYVSFSPDGQAWTTNAEDRNIQWYRKGETVSTGIVSTLAEPREGEHYYDREAGETVPVGRWVVEHEPGQCIHDDYPPEYHGLSYGRHTCEARHYSGWYAYCADCGELVSGILVYMSREAAETIDYIPMGMDYYSLCPFCDNLEQGRMFRHTCRAVSANMYRVIYDGNFPEQAGNTGGYMADSLHIYGDAKEYEGMSVTPVKELTRNAYGCTGYRFTGWNSRPDGSGDAYEDGARIRNLTAENWNGLPGRNEAGTVILYAQWEPVSSTLQIDPDGGAYDGNGGITEITMQYGQTYAPDVSLLEPPAGYVVTFQVNGGLAIQPAAAAKHFREWAMVQPFSGFFQNGVYRYIAEDGSTDTLRAVYEAGSIVLPQAEREGYSFGGWYYDREFRRPAGGAGDAVTPARDLTLYAQWVDLTLKAADNYSAYGGSGAVNLSWRMGDGKGKTYLLYQSLDGEEWLKISAADDICSETDVHLALKKTGREESYTVPHTGIYTIALSGAQGGSYKSFEGGKGGSVELKVWLEKGEVLTFAVGGRDGYNGGGSGSIYGGGGGCTVLSSDKKGLIAVAGGGGGASESGNGGAGGSSAALVGTGYAGEDGMAGGGGGCQGGAAGEYIRHTHGAACYREVAGTINAGPDFFRTSQSWYSGVYAQGTTVSGLGVCAAAHSGSNYPAIGLSVGNRNTYLETPYAGTLTFTDADSDMAWTQRGNGVEQTVTTVTVWFIHEDGSVTRETVSPERLNHTTTVGKQIWYQSGSYQASRPIYTNVYVNRHFYGTIETRPHSSCEYPTGSFHGVGPLYKMRGTFRFEVAEDVKGVYIEAVRTVPTGGEGCWMSIGVQNVSYQYSGRTLKCGYEEGQLESAQPAYGGSSYVNPDAVLSFSAVSGDRAGDGRAILNSVRLGFQEELELEGVRAADLEAPGVVSPESVKMTPGEDGSVSVSWGEPADKGTTYYHRAEAYLKGSTSLLCTSNITQNTLVSGVAGYYYVIDGEKESSADRSGRYTAARNAEIALSEEVRYLHLAAVDKAGNIGETIHIRLVSENVPWNIGTRQLQVGDGENVCPAENANTYYVRCDGVTPFLLRHCACMEGPAVQEGGLAYSIFESALYGQSILYTPPGENPAEPLYFAKGAPPLGRYPYSVTRRSSGGQSLEAEQMFTLGMEAHGQYLEVIPRAGAVFTESGAQKVYYSELAADACNGVILVGDGEGPVISGMDVLSDKRFIDRQGEVIRLQLTAEDSLSGVAEFFVRVTNRDNYSARTYYPEDGIIELDITKAEALFTGEFTVTACARDKVGNVTEVSGSVTEFALETRIERILAPHDPVFKCGESGILYITVYGYADRVEVEFPPELAAADERLKKTVFDYTDRKVYRQTSEVQFMVPLYTAADRDYTVRIRAFRGDKSLESSPVLHVTSEGGDVLSEFRTRLR